MKRLNLNDISRHDPFEVPEGYLDKLPQQIQQRIATSRQSWSITAPELMVFPRLQLAISLMVLLLVAVFYWAQPRNLEETNAAALLNETPKQEVAEYLDTYTSLSQQELVSLSSWENKELNQLQNFATAEVLEKEILLELDVYTAEELWK